MKPNKKTKHVKFEELEMSAYLVKERKSTAISKIIFSVRSGTLDLKDWHPLSDENIEHFISCKAYGKECILFFIYSAILNCVLGPFS